MKKPIWIILIVALAVIALDQLSKYLVSMYLPLGGAWSPLPGPHPLFQIVHTYNTGVAFGMFKNLGPVFVVIALVISGVIIAYARKLRSDQWLT